MSADGNGRRQLALHIGPTPFFSDRGCHVRIRGLILALQGAGTDALLCTYHHGRDVEGVRTERAARIPGYTHRRAGPSGFKYLADLLLLWRVCGAIRRHRPEVLHGHLHEGALIGEVARRLFFWRRLPLVFDMQGSLVGELEGHGYFRRAGWLRRAFALLERLIDRLPDRIAASSRASMAIARDRFGVPPERLVLVPDGVDVGPPDPERRAALRRELDLPAGKPVVVYSGSLLPVKGVAELHEVIGGAVQQGVDVHFLVVGYPVDATRAFLDEHGLSGRCTLTGRVEFERIGELLGIADAALEPKAGGAGEASGKLLNYMGAGLPVVCFDTPNNREMLGDAGCYAEAGSTASMVEAIGRLVADPERARALGRAGRERALAEYSWEASAARLREIYSQLAGRPTPVPRREVEGA